MGELSAINAVAGAYSEYVPIVHIVGTPSTESMKDGMLLHHTLGNGDFNVFANMGASIACSVAKLVDAHDAATLCDNALRECWVKSRPVYITLPTDMIAAKVEGQRLKTPIDLSFPENEAEKEDYVVETVLKYLHAAKSPIILVDACAVRHRVLDEVHDLIRTSNLPYFVAPMGKGAVDESGPHYGGVYAGDASHKEVRERVESSDLVLSIGALKTDFNTAGFTYRVSQLSTIDFHSTYVRVKYSEYPGVGMKGVLRKIIKMMGELNVRPGSTINNEIAEGERDLRGAITHNWLWPRLGHWLQEDDIVITETGTANLGIWETRFPKGVTALNQVLWGSIGYSVGACQGAALAARETGSRRTVLWVGDGSLQVTAQEISTIIRHDLKPIMSVLVLCGDTMRMCC